MNKIVERIERELGIPGLVSLLAERLAPTDLQSLLLEVYRIRSSQRRPADVLSSYESDRFVRPAASLRGNGSHSQRFRLNSSPLRSLPSVRLGQVLSLHP